MIFDTDAKMMPRTDARDGASLIFHICVEPVAFQRQIGLQYQWTMWYWVLNWHRHLLLRTKKRHVFLWNATSRSILLLFVCFAFFILSLSLSPTVWLKCVNSVYGFVTVFGNLVSLPIIFNFLAINMNGLAYFPHE